MSNSVKKYELILFFLLTALHPLFSQDSLIVSGKIVANRHTPLKDVSVSVEGVQALPELTDQNGEFTITVSTGDVWLIINPIGKYKSKRVFLNSRKEVLISLTDEDMKSGYDYIPVICKNERQRDIITAFTDIDMDILSRKNIVSIDQALQGVVPGMFSTSHSGMPGQGNISFLRGIRSMNTSNAPLFIVDGMPIEGRGLFESYIEGNSYNPMTTINPNDISRITIYKGTAVTSLYGTKASNGVVLIQTLAPKATQTSITISVKGGMNLFANNFIPLLSSTQYKSLANEILASSSLKEEKYSEEYPGLYVNRNDDEYYKYMHNTNWQSIIFSNSLFSDNHISLKGGSEIATYGLSVGYRKQGGVFKNTNYDRFSVLFVSHLNVFPKFKMDINVNLVSNNSHLKESAYSFETSPVMTSLSKPPIFNPFQYDEKGNRLSMLDDVDELGTSNPLAVVENYKGENKNYRFISSIKSHVDISKTVIMNTLLGVNFNTLKEFVFMPNKGMEKYYGGEAHNVSRATNNYLFSFYTDNYLSYSKQNNSLHSFNSSIGFRIKTNLLQIDYGEAWNMPENDEYTNLQSGQYDLRQLGGNNGRWNWLSVYNQITYKYKDRYIINTGLSADYSTRTGDEAQTAFHLNELPFGLFYSISAGWRISEEAFLNQFKGLENFILRASYGVVGNDDIGNCNALDYYSLLKYRETSGLVPGSIVNKLLKYEKFNQFNAGFDFSLWGGRTRLTTDYFVTITKDMLIYEPQESYIGYYYRTVNTGEVKNNGWDFSVFHRLMDRQKFKWDIFSVFSLLSNEVIDIEGNELVTRFKGGEFITRKGDPINSFYGYQFEGVYSTYEEAEEADLVNHTGMQYGAGDAIFKDFSGPENIPDGIIDDYDKVNLGSPIPDWYGSFSNNFRYNRWYLNVMVQFVFGNELFNYVRYMNENMTDLSNQSENILKRWQYEGDKTDVPRALWNDPVGNSDFSSRWIEDGSYIRLKNITLGYTIPDKFLVFKNANFYITVTNLFTMSNYLGYDPEFSYSVDPMKQGIDYGLMPQFCQFMFGIQIGL